MAKKTKAAPPHPVVSPQSSLAHVEGLRVEQWPIGRLVGYPGNPRQNDGAVDLMCTAITEFGFRIPIVAKSDGLIVDGHLRHKAALKLGIKTVPVALSDELTDVQIKAFRLLANQSANWAEWDMPLLKMELESLKLADYPLELTGFDDIQLVTFMAGVRAAGDPDATPEPSKIPATIRGDLWRLGRHRLLCGDSTLRSDVERLLGGVKPDLILTDPPYCSGGFQESNKSIGSVGTDAPHKQVANDRLSSRGYSQLLKSAFSEIGAPFLYAFTDWRMWTFLFDVAESSGFGVRSMIVWDKETPGMGKGWRSQHELIMWATKEIAPFEYVGGRGNVLQHARTGNVLHTTEKPAELVADLLNIAEFSKIIADPFVGSGTTIIASEMTGRTCYATEIDPAYIDVSVIRWQEYAKQQATLEATGQTFEEVARERLAPPSRAKRNKKKSTSSALQSTA